MRKSPLSSLGMCWLVRSVHLSHHREAPQCDAPRDDEEERAAVIGRRVTRTRKSDLFMGSDVRGESRSFLQPKSPQMFDFPELTRADFPRSTGNVRVVADQRHFKRILFEVLRLKVSERLRDVAEQIAVAAN